MSKEYHLLTQFGTGVSATISIGSPAVVTRSLHRCKADGTPCPVVFTTTGTLPTGVTSDTTYYAIYATGTSYMYLYDTRENAITAGATGRINTSGSQAGTHTITGGYWANLPATDQGDGGNYRARYGAPGSENVHLKLQDWYDIITDGAYTDITVDVILEVQGNWKDNSYCYNPIGGWKSIYISSFVNGVRDPDAFHFGVVGGGYINQFDSTYRYLLNFLQPNCTVDGLEFIIDEATSKPPIRTNAPGVKIEKCIISAPTGIYINTSGITVIGNIVHGCTKGISEANNAVGNLIAFNLVYNCDSGFDLNIGNATSDTSNTNLIGNIAVKNNVNWEVFIRTGATYRNRYVAQGNCGEASDVKTVTFVIASGLVTLASHGFTPEQIIKFIDNGDTLPTGLEHNVIYYARTITTDTFTLSVNVEGDSDIAMSGTDSGTHSISLIYDTVSSDPALVLTSADFTSYATDDMTPVVGATQLDTIASEDSLPITETDITDAIRPNYEASSFPNNLSDAGPFEYDHGDGLAPQTVTLKITAGTTTGTPIVGARVRLLKTSDSSVVLEGITDSSGILQDTAYTYTADTDVTGWVRKSTSAPRYKQGVISGTITENGLTATIAMVSDE